MKTLTLYLCLFLVLLFFFPSDGASLTFRASVTAADIQKYPAEITLLGAYDKCRLVRAFKKDPEHSACYLYQDEQQLWVLKSYAAICKTRCVHTEAAVTTN
ncbi:hypothetical protein [Thalassomonas actiniarum]|uniref:Uncharacterized protein n=1 Tax=Thalassomonas actiniarum TaxID=485447 RepID=A0AAE9YRQ3_9GAMM|nr:hypothetical protein [Thalassomonas actiniarum]WDE00010.1 hypothetical protein SG35_004930 [Thalassomonas actiniarum]